MNKFSQNHIQTKWNYEKIKFKGKKMSNKVLHKKASY